MCCRPGARGQSCPNNNGASSSNGGASSSNNFPVTLNQQHQAQLTQQAAQSQYSTATQALYNQANAYQAQQQLSADAYVNWLDRAKANASPEVRNSPYFAMFNVFVRRTGRLPRPGDLENFVKDL